MSIRCSLGVHKWKPIMRRREKTKMEWVEIMVFPSLFAGPPYMQKLFQYPSKYEWRGDKCDRCGLRRHKGE